MESGDGGDGNVVRAVLMVSRASRLRTDTASFAGAGSPGMMSFPLVAPSNLPM